MLGAEYLADGCLSLGTDFFSLPSGSGFILAPDHEDVWTDVSLVKVEPQEPSGSGLRGRVGCRVVQPRYESRQPSERRPVDDVLVGLPDRFPDVWIERLEVSHPHADEDKTSDSHAGATMRRTSSRSSLFRVGPVLIEGDGSGKVEVFDNVPGNHGRGLLAGALNFSGLTSWSVASVTGPLRTKSAASALRIEGTLAVRRRFPVGRPGGDRPRLTCGRRGLLVAAGPNETVAAIMGCAHHHVRVAGDR
jgi:hypothetical protein